MSSRAAVLSGKPRVRRSPRAVANEVDDAVFLASSYGLTPDAWQEDVLESWLGRRSDGRWAAATCGLAVPRQNGKNAIIEVRELFGMVALGEKFLHTAHEVKTARKAFLRISSFFENERQYPELAGLVKEIRKTNGQEAVILRNGGSVEFIARSRGSGRGFTVDVLVCDEAQELTSEELAALLPTISASPLGNPQVVFTGTPPKPDRVQGEVFRGVRGAGEAGTDARLAWTDFGATDGPLPDVADRGEWYARNPGMPHRLAEAEVERELGLMTPEGFASERLGWWGDPIAASTSLPMAAWRACADPTSAIDGRPWLAAAMTPDRSTVSLVAAGRRTDGLLHVEVVLHGPAGAWFVPKVSEIASRQNAQVAVVPSHPIGGLVADFEKANVRLRPLTSGDYIQACGAFYDDVTASRLRYIAPQPELDAAIGRATRKASGEAWRWAGDDISALVAATQAAQAVRMAPIGGKGRAIALG